MPKTINIYWNNYFPYCVVLNVEGTCNNMYLLIQSLHTGMNMNFCKKQILQIIQVRIN